jgi:hypothetical protein
VARAAVYNYFGPVWIVQVRQRFVILGQGKIAPGRGSLRWWTVRAR